MQTVRTEQQDRSKHAAAITFNYRTQRIQNLIERNTGGDHFQKALLAVKQCLTALLFRHIDGRADVFDDLARFIENWVADSVNVFHRAVGQDDPVVYHTVVDLLAFQSLL